MFPLITILTILICAVPLCLAISFLVLYSGWPFSLAVAVGITLFVVSTTVIIRGLVLKNIKPAS